MKTRTPTTAFQQRLLCDNKEETDEFALRREVATITEQAKIVVIDDTPADSIAEALRGEPDRACGNFGDAFCRSATH